MKSFRSITLSCLVVSLYVHAQNPTPRARLPALKKGLIIEQVTTNSQAQRAGVRIGDLLLGWKRGSLHGDFQSPFDLAYVFLEQAPRGPITVIALRGGKPLGWQLGSDSWGFSARPNFFRPTSLYLPSKRTKVCLWQIGGCDRRRTHLAASLPSEAPPWLRPWLLSQLGKKLVALRGWKLGRRGLSTSFRPGGRCLRLSVRGTGWPRIGETAPALRRAGRRRGTGPRRSWCGRSTARGRARCGRGCCRVSAASGMV